MSALNLTQHFDVPAAVVYRALIDPVAVSAWMFPDGMSIHIHSFESRVGGRFPISLTYEDDIGVGKSSARTDTYRGRFVDLVPNERVVQALEFETEDPSMQGEMSITFALTEIGGSTLLDAWHENVPSGISPADNETGWRMSLARLKQLVEQGRTGTSGDPPDGASPS
ncbi:SRPBCC domain-containing protein [Microvirga mediterraneensis]|uniref:SRPBCC domain-containing protein n=1 Tax=Microvirga mediterraneensis TaxID=2754695 RepID=A0A838BRF1_9HYPH|nr:SRPBCC domain-containing protein [Microvirga mediterraneensis]MBA1158127.1 SRPBCC domain-containing protein [Microvirga mediterraneensis]